MTQEQFDNISNPFHYGGKDNPYETIKIIRALNFSYEEGNVFKYLSRWRKKNGVEDLKKARQYLDFLIEYNSPVNLEDKSLKDKEQRYEKIEERCAKPLTKEEPVHFIDVDLDEISSEELIDIFNGILKHKQ